jgi:hypothetical protein
MKKVLAERIRDCYLHTRGDSKELFRTILSVASETGLDAALECLESCISEKRAAWLEKFGNSTGRTGYALRDGYKLFYEQYLGLSIPRDGEIIEANERRIVMRWWNPCPTLEACQVLGLDTREICKKAYQLPVQNFLTKINPRLTFKRNYEAIRPYAGYCEESIELGDRPIDDYR